MYVKQSPIKAIKYYLITLAAISAIQVYVAINIVQQDKHIGWESSSAEEILSSNNSIKNDVKDFSHEEGVYRLVSLPVKQ